MKLVLFLVQTPPHSLDAVIRHGEESDEKPIIYTGENISLYHAEDKKEKEEKSNPLKNSE